MLFLHHFYKYARCSRVYYGRYNVALSSDPSIDNHHLYTFLFITLFSLQQFLDVQSHFINLIFLFLNLFFFLFYNVYYCYYNIALLLQIRNCLINKKRNIYNYYNEQTDRTTLQRYNNCNKHRRIKRKIYSKREILNL